ncbi:MFS transporter [Amycolatopsis aidingensis]|uniref:MFS transporter n=1 Tax=Amycolatopsis aidingensis TaxID=2842453 RepID=UPI001C0C9B18|nr:MFS transporter [Amycolatopsis aidingensis]
MRFGPQSDPDGPRSGRQGKGRRKSKRKWTPEPGSDRPRPVDRTRVEQPPAQPTRQAYPAQSRGYPPPPPAGNPAPTADEAPTGAVPAQGPPAPPPPPPRGARPYPPPPNDQWRSQPAYRESAPPQQPPPPVGDFERYGTDGYERRSPHRPPHQPPPPPQPQPQPQPEAGEQTEARSGFEPPPQQQQGSVPKLPKKITVTRVAALRGRQLTGQAVDAFHRATRADGADKSGLTSMTYATMLNYASDAAMAVALANTLFFAASTGESRGRVALYLLITIAPFALVAPVIGPALDRIQRGRRLAICITSAGSALMCVIMALHFNDWGLYPAALGKMVLSKSFMVLKAAVAPRVVPPDITLAKTNARLTVFGLVAMGASGAVASGFNWAFDSPGALFFAAAICVAGAVQAMRIPAWVEVTEGEVPASLSAHPERRVKKKRQPMGRHVVVALWGTGTIRVLTGFLMMFSAFAVKAQTEDSGQSPFVQLLMLGVIGAAAGTGGFLGNALGSRLHLGRPDQVIVGCVAGVLAATLLATVLAGLGTAAIVGLVGATASALAKISLDAVIQDDLPDASRASAFGRSETVLQLSWCGGGAIGLLLPPTYWIGFLVVSALLAVGLAQTHLVRKGGSLIPGLGGDRPLRPGATGNGGSGNGGGTSAPHAHSPHH